MNVDPNDTTTPITPEERAHLNSMYFLFVLLPSWEETGTICKACHPNGSSYDSVCLCPRPWSWRPIVPGTTISSETAGGN